jgi:hypothetical protein
VLASAVASCSGPKLYFKDAQQLTNQYEVKADRVRYQHRAKRREEIPLEMVDLDRTVRLAERIRSRR